MAVVPNDIALTQADALAPSTPKTPARTKKAKPEAAPQAKAIEHTAETAVAAPVAPVAAKEAAANDSSAAGAASQGKKSDKGAQLWYVARNERTLRARAEQSHVFMTKKLTLSTYHAQDILERTMDIWSDAMITLSETMRIFKSEEHCVIVDREVDRHMDECFSAITASLTRLSKMAESNGLDMDEIEVEYQAPSTQTLKVRSPREMRYHTLMLELDKLCMLTDKLWMFKLLSDRNRSQIPYETKRQIIRMVNRVRTLVFRAQASNERAAAAAKATSGTKPADSAASGTAATPQDAAATDNSATAASADVTEAVAA